MKLNAVDSGSGTLYSFEQEVTHGRIERAPHNWDNRGRPAGIGPEVVIKALSEPALYNEVKPLVFADRSVLEQTVKMLSVDIDLHAVNNPHKGHYEVGCNRLY